MATPQFYRSGNQWYVRGSPYPLPQSSVGIGPGGAPVFKVGGQWVNPSGTPSSSGYKQINPETGEEMGTRFTTPLVTVEDPRRVARGDSIWSGHQALMQKQTDDLLRHGAVVVQGGVVHRPGDIAQAQKISQAQQSYSQPYAQQSFSTGLNPLIQVKQQYVPQKNTIDPNVKATQFNIPKAPGLTNQFSICMKHNAKLKNIPCKPTTKYEECWMDVARGLKYSDECYNLAYDTSKAGSVAKTGTSVFSNKLPIPFGNDTPSLPTTEHSTGIPFGNDTPGWPPPEDPVNIPFGNDTPSLPSLLNQPQDLPPTTADDFEVSESPVEIQTIQEDSMEDISDQVIPESPLVQNGSDFEEEFFISSQGSNVGASVKSPLWNAPTPTPVKKNPLPLNKKKDNTLAWVVGIGLAIAFLR